MGTCLLPGVWKRQAERNLSFPCLASARTAHSFNLCEKNLLVLCSPGKLFSRKSQEKFHISSVGRMESMHKGWEQVPSSGRVCTHVPAQPRERWHLGVLWCPSELWLSSALPFSWGAGTSLASAFSITQMQRRQCRGKQREVETHIIFPFHVPFQLKVETSSKQKVTCAGGTSLEKK